MRVPSASSSRSRDDKLLLLALLSLKDMRFRTVVAGGCCCCFSVVVVLLGLLLFWMRGSEAGKDVKRKGVDVSDVSALSMVSVVVSNKSVVLAAVVCVPRDDLGAFFAVVA